MAALSPQCATDPIIKDITELCDFCSELIETVITDPEPGASLDKWYTQYAIEHFTQESGLETCELCETIAKDFSARRPQLGLDPLTPSDWKRSSLKMLRLYSSGIHSPDPADLDKICGVRMNDFEYRMWADEGSPACAALINQTPIHRLHMSKVCDLAQHWRNECDAHEGCLTEDDVPMPSRVLELCGDDTQPSIKLIESKGQTGRYLALSHCWGSPERPPLRTISENFQAHRNRIPFGDLPKTFQDAVEFTQGIGIRYIWIDSLCIIQNNHQDWLSEAAKMGDVYRNAALVIAASGAKDSSEGLFITDRPPATVLRLSYTVADEVKGTFNMTRSPTIWEWHPGAGPLDRRAWTLQERYLARRLITFMPKGVTWICKTTSVTEARDLFNSFGLEERWFRLLQGYTRRNLTNPSDRTEAIRGIAEEVQKSRNDSCYIPKYGVWEETLVIQLLWTCVGPHFDDGNLPDVPSWSWVQTKGAKKWPDETTYWPYQSVLGAREMPKNLTITSAGQLQIVGHLSAQLALSSVPYEVLQTKIGTVHSMQEGYTMTEDDRKSFRILTNNVESGKQVLGLARHDGGEIALYTHVWLLLETDHKQELRPRTGNETKNDDGMRDHADLEPDYAFWALLLEPVTEGRYKRVGVAILLPSAYEILKIGVQKFEIV